MRRIALMGISGGGETTLGKALAARLGVSYIELDALQHGPNWTESTPEELRAGVTAAQIDSVVRTGGSSSIPIFIDMLAQRFGSEKIVTQSLFTGVATGLAVKAAQLSFEF